MHVFLALLYVGGLVGSALTLRALTRAETARRGYVYAAASSAMLIAVLAFGMAA